MYYNNKNTIFIRKNAVCSKEILFHELTHLSSNNSLDSMRRIGFFYDNTKEHFSIGYGINEGYTAYFNFKLFGSVLYIHLNHFSYLTILPSILSSI